MITKNLLKKTTKTDFAMPSLAIELLDLPFLKDPLPPLEQTKMSSRTASDRVVLKKAVSKLEPSASPSTFLTSSSRTSEFVSAVAISNYGSGIGLENIEIQRIREMIASHPAFTQKVFTKKEQAYCEKYQDPFSRFAGRWAAKQAICKAMKEASLSWLDFEILNNALGKPEIYFFNPNQKIPLLLSISHSQKFATAIALADAKGGLGNDLIETHRVGKGIEAHGAHFLNKIFTKQEQRSCNETSDPLRSFASYFAAKEAIVKAMGTGIGTYISWLDIDLISKGNQLFYEGREKWLVSSSTSSRFATAVALKLFG